MIAIYHNMYVPLIVLSINPTVVRRIISLFISLVLTTSSNLFINNLFCQHPFEFMCKRVYIRVFHLKSEALLTEFNFYELVFVYCMFLCCLNLTENLQFVCNGVLLNLVDRMFMVGIQIFTVARLFWENISALNSVYYKFKLPTIYRIYLF